MNFKENSKFEYILFYIIAFLMLILAVMFTVFHYDYVNNWTNVDGRIVEINHDEKEVFVTYKIDGVSFRESVDIYSNDLQVRDKVDLLVSNERKVYAYEYKEKFIVLYLESIPVFAIGTFFFVRNKKRYNLIKLCKENGVKKRAEIVKVIRSVVNNRSGRNKKIIVSYNNEYYKSYTFYLYKKLEKSLDTTVDLYLLDDGKYYVDINSLRFKDNK